jgi:hypothetical protein
MLKVNLAQNEKKCAAQNFLNRKKTSARKFPFPKI